MDITECFHALKGKEHVELSELKRKRQDVEETVKRGMKKQQEEKELTKLAKLKMDLMNKLQECRRERLVLELEAESWERIVKVNSDKLRDLEMKLNEMHTKIWQSRGKFCDGVDQFLNDCDEFVKRHARGRNVMPEKIQCEADTNEEMESLETLIAVEEERGRALDEAIRDLEEAKMREENNDDRKRLEEWVKETDDRCRELQAKIDEKRGNHVRSRRWDNRERHISMQTAKNQLFSIMDLDRVRRLSKSQSHLN